MNRNYLKDYILCKMIFLMTITKYKENKYRGADNSFSAPAYFKCHTVENTIVYFIISIGILNFLLPNFLHVSIFSAKI